jgi:FxsC-like protein
VAEAIKYTDDDLGKLYAKEGLRYVMKQKRYEDKYWFILNRFARKIIKAAEDYPLTETPGQPVFASVPDAFREPAISRPHGAGSAPGGGPRYAQFIYVVGRRADLRAGRTLLEPYGDDDELEWRPYLPPSDEPAPLLTQPAAQTERLFCDHRCCNDQTLMNELEQYERENRLVVLIVDPWTLKEVVRYRTVMEQVDTKRFLNCVLLLSWNEDDETQQQAGELEKTVQLTFPRLRLSANIFRYPIKSPDQFREALLDALHQSRRNVLEFLKVKRPVTGDGPSAPPVISSIPGPGGQEQ